MRSKNAALDLWRTMTQETIAVRMLVFAGMVCLLTGCGIFETTPTQSTTPTFTPDPCTGWWCSITGVVYEERAVAANALQGAVLTLYQTSFCSPTSGQHSTVTSPDGEFEFNDVFLHDTDTLRIQVEYEAFESAQWVTGGFECLHCSCFQSPLEIVLRAAPLAESTPRVMADCFIYFYLSAWQDLNEDGSWDPSEPSLEGVEFRIAGRFASMLSKYPCISNQDGQCTINIWSPGLCSARDYTITAVPPESYEATTSTIINCSLSSVDFSHEAQFGFHAEAIE